MAKKRTKKNSCLGHRIAGGLGALMLVAALLLIGARYGTFVSRTVYQESVSHLREIVHLSTTMLDEPVEKNITNPHMLGRQLCYITNEDRIRNYVEEAREEIGFSRFYFLSSDGRYMTPEGETGYLGLQGNLEDQIGQGRRHCHDRRAAGETPDAGSCLPEAFRGLPGLWLRFHRRILLQCGHCGYSQNLRL